MYPGSLAAGSRALMRSACTCARQDEGGVLGDGLLARINLTAGGRKNTSEVTVKTVLPIC